MTTKYDSIRKQNFINKTTQQIKVYKILMDGVKICRSQIAKFDGKVANVRLTKAMKEQPNALKVYFSLNGSINITTNHERHYQLVNSCGCGYVDCSAITVKLITNDQNRIDATQMIAHADTQIQYLKNQIAGCENDLAIYDEEAEAWEELKNHIEEYKAKFSARLRGTIDMRK